MFCLRIKVVGFIPVEIFPPVGNVRFAIRPIVHEVGMFIDVKNKNGKTAPNTTLAMRVTCVDA